MALKTCLNDTLRDVLSIQRIIIGGWVQAYLCAFLCTLPDVCALSVFLCEYTHARARTCTCTRTHFNDGTWVDEDA